MDTQWEYTTVKSYEADLHKKLNTLGEEGWEVVAAGASTQVGAPNQLILKRQKKARKRDDDYGYGR